MWFVKSGWSPRGASPPARGWVPGDRDQEGLRCARGRRARRRQRPRKLARERFCRTHTPRAHRGRADGCSGRTVPGTQTSRVSPTGLHQGGVPTSSPRASVAPGNECRTDRAYAPARPSSARPTRSLVDDNSRGCFGWCGCHGLLLSETRTGLSRRSAETCNRRVMWCAQTWLAAAAGIGVSPAGASDASSRMRVETPRTKEAPARSRNMLRSASFLR